MEKREHVNCLVNSILFACVPYVLTTVYLSSFDHDSAEVNKFFQLLQQPWALKTRICR